MTMTIAEFCNKHAACAECREWAIATGLTTMSELWKRADITPEWRVWIATRPGVLDDRTLLLFACWCVRQVWHLLTDDRSRNAVEVAERFAVGKATVDELSAAFAAAWAARAAAWAASAAAWADWAASDDAWATGDAARAARAAAWAVSAAASAASDAARAASDAARAAAWADWAAAWDAQSARLIANATPNFDQRGFRR
jgi:hypothetical protein